MFISNNGMNCRMGEVFKSPYRQPPTPKGIEKIEKGKLEWFDIEMYSNFNTGLLEQYFDERNKTVGFRRSSWIWWQVLIGVVIGVMFAAINQYVGLKIGMVIGGSWYISYLIGMGLGWRATEINIASGASTGASMICTGFVFTFPAMYILAYEEGGIISPGDMPSISIVIIATIFAGILGVLYFIIFRRVWLVEDPLPMPTFEAWVQLLDIANDVSAGAVSRARKTIRRVSLAALLSGTFTFFRDFPLIKGEKSILDDQFGGDYYSEGDVHIPADTFSYTWVDFQLTPLLVATGWFMRWRTALLVSLGTLFTWFVVVPMAVHLEAPVWIAGHTYHVTDVPDWIPNSSAPSLIAYAYIARIMAIGAILGGGITGLLKMAPVFKTATKDLLKIKKTGVTAEYIPGSGWYEWPISHIMVMVIVTFLAVSVTFVSGGFPPLQTILLAILLVGTTFFLGAIAVKVMGETSIEPVSGTSFIVTLLLITIFKAVGTSDEVTVIMGIIGTTVFGGAISMSGDIILDFKNALYIGNRPYLQMKGELTGIIPGAIVAGIFAVIFSEGLARGELNLLAPQANAFAIFIKMLVGGHIDYTVFFLGAFVGVFVELLTGMGTAFGLGMYFPLGLAFPLMLGGGLRDLWQKNVYEKRSKIEGWDEKTRTIKLLDTYMIATGLIIGEAIIGTVVAVYMFTTM